VRPSRIRWTPGDIRIQWCIDYAALFKSLCIDLISALYSVRPRGGGDVPVRHSDSAQAPSLATLVVGEGDCFLVRSEEAFPNRPDFGLPEAKGERRGALHCVPRQRGTRACGSRSTNAGKARVTEGTVQARAIPSRTREGTAMGAVLAYDTEAADRLVAIYTTRRRRPAAAGPAGPHLRSGDRVLAVGVGPGFLASAMAEIVGPAGCIRGVDTASPSCPWPGPSAPISHGWNSFEEMPRNCRFLTSRSTR